MTKIFTRIGISLVVVLTTYTAYALVAVPLIEPQTRLPGEVEKGPRPKPGSAKKPSNAYNLDTLFPEGAWELDAHRTKILDTDHGKLFFRDFKPQDDGSIEVTPFTVIFYAADSSNRGNSKPTDRGRPIVMRAPDGAVLKFDRPMKLGQSEAGRLIGGRLRGEISIHSPESSPGAGDELNIVTREIQMDEPRIFTPHDVKFQFGRHWGSGRNLTIQMIPSARGNQAGLAIGGIKSLELVNVDKVHIRTEDRGFLSRETDVATTSQPSVVDKSAPTNGSSAPLEVTCRGPFIFDFEKSVASFEDHVDVRRIRPDGPSDQLNCRVLEIHFAGKDRDASRSTRKDRGKQIDTTDPSNMMSGLKAERLVAIGDPVQVHSSYELESQKLEYEIGPPGQFGVLWADGPGKIFDVGDDGARAFAASWKKELIVQPHEGKRVISLLDGAVINFTGTGEFSANELHMWVAEIPERTVDGKEQTRIVPDKILALGNVQIESQRLSGATKRVEAWFKNQASSTAGPAKHTDKKTSATRSKTNDNPFSVSQRRRDGQSVQKYNVTGDLVRLQLLWEDRNTTVQNVTVAGDVRLTEIKTKKPSDIPLRVTGNVLHLAPGVADNATVEVTGKPAKVEARGLKMSGQRINLDQGGNRLWMDNPGQMTLPPRRSRLGQNVRMGGETLIIWKGRMHFDGRVAHFEGRKQADGTSEDFARDVTTRSTQQMSNGDIVEVKVEGHELKVMLTQRVDFTATQGQTGDAELQSLEFSGGVFVENHTRDRSRQLVAIDRLKTRTLNIDQRSDRLTADGPGWANTIRIEDGSFQATRPVSTSPNYRDRQASELMYAHIDFRRGILGNLAKHEVQFLEQVKVIQGPVKRWNEVLTDDRRGGLGERGMVLTCDRLVAAEMGPIVRGRRMVELQALGNALLEGSTFAATAERMSYSQAKDLIVMEGSAREDAQIRRQARVGGRVDRAAAHKILYWRTENRFEVGDARRLELTQDGLSSGFFASPRQ